MTHVPTITDFVIREFLPDVPASDIDPGHDLLNGGVIDSLGLLKLIAWIEDRFDVVVGDADLDPDNFRSITAVDRFVSAARQPAGG